MAGQSSRIGPDTLAKARAARTRQGGAEISGLRRRCCARRRADLADMPEIDGTAEPWPPMIIRSRR